MKIVIFINIYMIGIYYKKIEIKYIYINLYNK